MKLNEQVQGFDLRSANTQTAGEQSRLGKFITEYCKENNTKQPGAKNSKPKVESETLFAEVGNSRVNTERLD
jgi:hypothetical protein